MAPGTDLAAARRADMRRAGMMPRTEARSRLLTELAGAPARRAYGIAYDLLGNRAEAEEAVQEGLVRACEAIAELREPAAAPAWFLRIVTTMCLRKDLALKPAQRQAIGKLRTDSDAQVVTAKKQLDALSGKLEAALANPATADADIARYVDQISAQEAVIRKARLLAWSQARRVLDDTQRAKVQGAVKPGRTK